MIRGEQTGLNAIVEEAESKFFRSKHARLKPVFHRLNEALLSLGGDVRPYIKTIYIGYARTDVFAVVFVRPGGFLEVGLALSEAIESNRLIDARKLGWKQITKSFRITSVEELDAEVLDWLRRAYHNG